MQKISSCFAALLFVFTVHAQVQVRFEPRHHNVYENDLVRILNVFLPPGDTSQYHVHSTPSVFISYTVTKTGSQLLGQPPANAIPAAKTIWYESLVKEKIHRVWNADTGWFHVMDIELTGKGVLSHPPLLKNDSLKLLLDEEQVNVYKLQLPAMAKTTLPATEKGLLIICLDKADVNISVNKKQQPLLMLDGHYQWIESGKAVSLQNNAAFESGFAILQLK
ncbi:MAG TPA: hypothetical protein PKM63_05780 [Panacibacter sp.]|nr:hypothetical protein [Panacibacter sp.]HNP43774.1 hypothetical protein [Panacibacter sp.]